MGGKVVRSEALG